ADIPRRAARLTVELAVDVDADQAGAHVSRDRDVMPLAVRDVALAANGDPAGTAALVHAERERSARRGRARERQAPLAAGAAVVPEGAVEDDVAADPGLGIVHRAIRVEIGAVSR